MVFCPTNYEKCEVAFMIPD